MAITSVMNNINTNETKSKKSLFVANAYTGGGVPMVGGEWRLCHNKKLNKINFHPKNGVVLVILDSQLSHFF